ncbi:hypothetical protein CEE44_00490 [Candidatus Woesearchaeota archaeon B3_Woes]|nr:MAG: hypothetical protein CEE44_00490 [Candidatus Woesearchaeota archaeon B3_Woes]
MSLTMPESTAECLYFTRRSLDNDGNAVAWVYKRDCPECGKAKMGKPVEKGKVKMRAKEYVCPECGYSEEKQEHEEKSQLEIIYKCPHCGFEGEATTEFKRKNLNKIPSYVFECGKCHEKIGITKRLK